MLCGDGRKMGDTPHPLSISSQKSTVDFFFLSNVDPVNIILVDPTMFLSGFFYGARGISRTMAPVQWRELSPGDLQLDLFLCMDGPVSLESTQTLVDYLM